MRKTIKFHSINLQIDIENLCDHAPKNEAKILVKRVRKRLPTNDECEDLRRLPWNWGKDKQGRLGYWVAERKEDLMNPEKSVFFPALGYQSSSTDKIYLPNSEGYYWLDAKNSNTDNDAWILFHSSSCLYNYNKTLGFSVRAVKSIKKR